MSNAMVQESFHDRKVADHVCMSTRWRIDGIRVRKGRLVTHAKDGLVPSMATVLSPPTGLFSAGETGFWLRRLATGGRAMNSI